MKVLVIGDTHFPAVHPGYLSFCEDLAEKFGCNKFIHIGDLVDWHTISRFDPQPEADGTLTEYKAAQKCVAKWKKSFPNLVVTEGNHDARCYRQAASVNIPARFLKGYNELWETSWDWTPSYQLDGVYYFHGTGVSGMYPAMNTMQKMLMSTVMGHIHSAAGINWRANPQTRMFGMSVGCGVDDRHVAFKYGEHLKVRSVLAAGVVLDGTPQHVIMPCGDGEKYNRARFKK